MADQPTAAPTRKVASGGLAGALSIVIIWILGEAGLDVPAAVASAITLIMGTGVAYFVPDG